MPRYETDITTRTINFYAGCNHCEWVSADDADLIDAVEHSQRNGHLVTAIATTSYRIAATEVDQRPPTGTAAQGDDQ